MLGKHISKLHHSVYVPVIVFEILSRPPPAPARPGPSPNLYLAEKEIHTANFPDPQLYLEVAFLASVRN